MYVNYLQVLAGILVASVFVDSDRSEGRWLPQKTTDLSNIMALAPEMFHFL